ncbi:MAG: RNA 2',3'-cyclic phosphodiesterase [Oscillospiraceae bacterium]|nr:RNA 2',3'-cyclic phosphodiesterase [Oscillospiraceae bacterium]
MRLFFAINFSQETVARLAALRDELRAASSRGNFSRDENLHLTLAFLGECDAKQLAAAKSALDSLKVRPADVRVDRLGRFRRDGGDVWWAGAAENSALSETQRELTDKLTAAGFRLESRPYSPHITLARECVTGFQPRGITPFGETVRSVELMKSERVQGKLTYTAIHRKDACRGGV